MQNGTIIEPIGEMFSAHNFYARKTLCGHVLVDIVSDFIVISEAEWQEWGMGWVVENPVGLLWQRDYMQQWNKCNIFVFIIIKYQKKCKYNNSSYKFCCSRKPMSSFGI